MEFARTLVGELGYRLLSTGGRVWALREAGLEVTDVSDYTGFPVMMEGRVKTLHPKVHGGLLARRDKPAHMEAAASQGIEMIDLVVLNLYPFEQTVAKRGVSLEEAIENIDIGGPSMLRSAAKNHESVTVVTDPADYPRVLEALGGGEGAALKGLRAELAQKVFARTAAYDKAISDFLAARGKASAEEVPDLEAISGLPARIELGYDKASSLRYGENPHQQAALYGSFFDHFEQLQGKELSFCNILDITAAAYLIGEFEPPTVAILKHTNPCGVGSGSDLMEAWERAYATDKQSPFGGIIPVNQTVTRELAEVLTQMYVEVVIAPDFSEEARALFKKKKNVRLMRVREGLRSDSLQDVRAVIGGLLVQDRDLKKITPGDCRVVTERAPTEAEWQALLFGWKVVKHVKSNAIVYAGQDRTLGIGAGQMSRVDSSKIAVMKAGNAQLDLTGSIVASDAYFPFADGLEAASDAGATAAIQPGGSMRDEEVIAAANARNMAMVFTGIRHFRH